MSYTIGWSEGEATVATASEAVAVLDGIAADPRGPFLVHVAPDDGGDSLIEMVFGRADRAMLTYTDAGFGGRAVDPQVPMATEDLNYDYGSVEPARTRLTAAQARRAIAEYVTTGRRPTCVMWQQ
jgi:hypothetical protein